MGSLRPGADKGRAPGEGTHQGQGSENVARRVGPEGWPASPRSRGLDKSVLHQPLPPGDPKGQGEVSDALVGRQCLSPVWAPSRLPGKILTQKPASYPWGSGCSKKRAGPSMVPSLPAAQGPSSINLSPAHRELRRPLWEGEGSCPREAGRFQGNTGPPQTPAAVQRLAGSPMTCVLTLGPRSRWVCT